MIKYLIQMHRFFVKESRTFMGVKKENKDKSYPIWGENKWWRRFDPNEHEMYKYTVVDVGYETYYAFRFKDLLYYPIAYIKFMWFCYQDYKKIKPCK